MGTRSIHSRTHQGPPFVHPPVLPGKGGREAMLQRQVDTLRMEFAEFYRELYETAQMQRTMSGPRHLRRGRFEIAAEIFPVRHLSGDFFAVSDLGPTTLLAVGDIAGKGLRAGMWFTYLLNLTRTCAESFAAPGDAVAELNRQLCQAQSGPPLTSLFLARLDWAHGTLTYCNAGHPAPLLLHADDSVEGLETGGPVLAAVHDASFETGTIQIQPGEMLVGYSDGLLEYANEAADQFGTERVIDELRKLRNARSANEVLFSMIAAAQDFAGTHAREDDCTVMVIRNQGSIAGS